MHSEGISRVEIAIGREGVQLSGDVAHALRFSMDRFFSTLPRLPSLIGFECTLPAVSLAPARQCQWPMWGDDEAPTEQYCGMGSVEGYSFCPGHRDLVFRPSARRTKALSGA